MISHLRTRASFVWSRKMSKPKHLTLSYFRSLFNDHTRPTILNKIITEFWDPNHYLACVTSVKRKLGEMNSSRVFPSYLFSMDFFNISNSNQNLFPIYFTKIRNKFQISKLFFIFFFWTFWGGEWVSLAISAFQLGTYTNFLILIPLTSQRTLQRYEINFKYPSFFYFFSNFFWDFLISTPKRNLP